MSAVSLGRGLQKDAVFFYIYQKKPVQSRQRFGITPRRGGGKARRIPSPPVTSGSGRSEKATAKRRRCAWPATNLESRPPPAAREKRNKQANASSSHGPHERNAAVTRPRPPQCDLAAPSPWQQERPAGLNSETLPVPRFASPAETACPPTTHRLRLTRGQKENGQFRCGLVGGTTARKGKVRRYWSGSR